MIYAKYDMVASMLSENTCSILDVGCRDGTLREHLRPGLAYTGIDMSADSAATKICDVEQGIPFGDGTFDAVVALDMLEHTDNIWFVFDELVRVSRHQVFVVLPNAYHWLSRLRYLAGAEFSKYVLPAEPVKDRHRWLVSHRQAKVFCQSKAQEHGLVLREKVIFGGRRTLAVDMCLDPICRNLSAWATMFVFSKRRN